LSQAQHQVIAGTPGRRITELAGSPNGRYLACEYVRKGRWTSDCSWLFFLEAAATFEEAGEMAPAPPALQDFSSTIRRSFAALDDGHCLFLQTNTHDVELVRYTPTTAGIAESARWQVCSLRSYHNAILRILPPGQEAVVLTTDYDDKDADWGGGGAAGEYTQRWFRVDLASGEIREESSSSDYSPPISIHDYKSSRGLSLLIAMGAPSWVGSRDAGECQRLRELIVPLTLKKLSEFAIHAGHTHLLTTWRVIEIASGKTVLQIKNDESEPVGARVFTRFHDLSPDGNYALSTVIGGHFELWNVPNRTSWRPELPAHGGVHCAVFLLEGKVALGTVEGGIIVVDCTPGLSSGDAPW
jgi:hypothetical protein